MNITATQLILTIVIIIAVLFVANWWMNGRRQEGMKQSSETPQKIPERTQPVNKSSNRLLAFYASWCGASQEFFKTWPGVEAALKPLGVAAIKIDAEANAELANYHGIISYPTLILVTPNKNFEYVGPRNPALIAQFVKQNMA